jgi:hypothetical protein
MPFKLSTCNSVFTLLQSKSGRPASTYVPIKTKFKNYDALPLMSHALEIYSRDPKSCVARFVRVANNECERADEYMNYFGTNSMIRLDALNFICAS